MVQGQGKLIIAASTPSQKAYESAAIGHGLFTEALLKGLKGEAANNGEVTINSLYDYIDKMDGQRPAATDDVRADDRASRPDALRLIVADLSNLIT